MIVIVANDDSHKKVLESHMKVANKSKGIKDTYMVKTFKELNMAESRRVKGKPPFEKPPQIKIS